MNLTRTKSYSRESIWTKIDDFQMENDIVKHRKLLKEDEVAFRNYQMSKAEMALDKMNTLMDQGYYEHEAWEIVSKEIVYRW